MEKNSNNRGQTPISDKEQYVTVKKDSKNREMREMGTKDRFLIIGISVAIILFLSPFIASLSDMYKKLPSWGRLIFLLIIFFVIWFIILKIKKRIRFFKNIECGSVWEKEVKIVDFEYSESENDRWYCIILSDWEKIYKGFYCRWAKIIGKTDDELRNDEFYGKNWIDLDLLDRDIIKKQLDKKISDLESQKKNENMLKKLKLSSEIGELQKKKNDLEPYHLHSKKWDFYLGDTYKILVDPEDSDNYILESETKREF